MAGAKYLGPADAFLIGNEKDGYKSYRVGDVVPLGKEALEHHAANGHRFDGYEPDVVAITAAIDAPAEEVAPKGDNGAPMQDVKEVRHAAAATDKPADKPADK